MQLIAAITQNVLRQIDTQQPLRVDFVAEVGAPFQLKVAMFDDAAATNHRGLWHPWSEYEEGEAVYLIPQGMESGQQSEHTPDTFGAFVCKRRSQHTEPGKPGSGPFWRPMTPTDFTGKTVELVFPGEEFLDAEGVVSGGAVTFSVSAALLGGSPSSRPYRVEVRAGTEVVEHAAVGQVVFRSVHAGSGRSPAPSKANIEIVRGSTFQAEIPLFKDAAETEPFDLTEWIVQLEPEGLAPITIGKGLAVPEPTSGVVEVELDAVTTSRLPATSTHFVLWAEREEVRLPAIAGPFQVTNP